MKTLRSRYHHTNGAEEEPCVSLDRVLAHVLSIPLPPGQTLFRNIEFEHEISSESVLKKLGRRRWTRRGTKDPKKPIERALARIAKDHSAGTVVGILDDRTVTSGSVSAVLDLPLIPFDQLQDHLLLRPGLSTARPRVLDLRKLHDVLMATELEVLRSASQAMKFGQTLIDHHFFLAKRAHAEGTESVARSVSNIDRDRRDVEVEKISMPAFCTSQALNELQILNIESRITWSEFLLDFPEEHRRNLWLVFSPEEDEPKNSILLCPLGYKNLVKAVLSVRPDTKVKFLDGVTVNGLYNEWPHNNSRLSESTRTLLCSTNTDTFKYISQYAISYIENGFLNGRGYINLHRVRELAEQPHSIPRYGNLLTRIYKAEQWLINLYSEKRQAEGYSWSSWIRKVGYWPTYDERSFLI